jgi:small conductance mechanosensitive channel
VKRARIDRPAANRNADNTTELTDAIMGQRREQRALALGQLLRSITAFIIGGITLLVVLTEIGMDIGPLLASAGVIGVALGFGAQTMVKDFLSGIFLVLEDQYGPGDVVDLGSAIGTVEEVGLRITRLRDASGVVWYVRNGEILRVGNRSQGWTLAIVDVPIAYDEDLDRVRRLVEKIGSSRRQAGTFTPGHGMASDKSSAEQRSQFFSDAQFDAARIGHDGFWREFSS